MKPRYVLAAAVTAAALLTTTGCAVVRDQQSVGSYLDDTAITTKLKAHYAENKVVDTTAISVETLKGVVQLSGFAKTAEERQTAEDIARRTQGVVRVVNSIVVKPK